MVALIIWSSIIGYFGIGAFVAGRAWLNLKLRGADFTQDAPPFFTVVFAFLGWWLFLILMASVWSAKRGLATDETMRLIKEKESDELRRRIEKHERELEGRPKTRPHEWRY